MRYGLVGGTLAHSYSPALHHRIGDYPYDLFPMAEEDLAAFFAARAFDGVNVTIPYKAAVIPYLDEVDSTAAALGAVNTVVNRGGRLFGYNTDAYGMQVLLARAGISLAGENVLILGSGGTAHTAFAVAQAAGAREIRMVSRTGKDGALTYAAAAAQSDTTVILNTTPVGMFPHEQEMPLPLDGFPCLRGVIDVIYHPLRTSLVLAARERGIPAAGGLYMLVAQALRAAELFGAPMREKDADTVYCALLQSKENIVLIGMPGAGKTTVGRTLATRLGRPFFDTDEEIVREAGRSIPAIFAMEGENGFRARESRVIARVSSLAEGAVIACGGGGVLRVENVTALRRTGRLYFLARDVAALPCDVSRPLSATRADILRLYERRLPLYRAAADACVPVREGNVAGTGAAIATEFREAFR